ncbi:male-specific lethal 3 homolog isoform X2 [Nilaparvata lugens]|uniref:male-specific lethal 3 homolog isoform X2 n=1 Tax=Nilaparvata lugens TaxID=108931 RepID=UPI00193EB016|nr:male-specific lethal 3 homolog isoform X2 [Nilaparvata lugens]
MVSTRGVKPRYYEGEVVLCYEPDPAKTKVLYDSKILEIIHSKDESGRKFVEFLIHFQGWNQTWDRLVTEDFILKDTTENRQLQKELAEKAQLTSTFKIHRGGNWYRRDRKKQRSKLSIKGGGSGGGGEGGSLEVAVKVEPAASAAAGADDSADDSRPPPPGAAPSHDESDSSSVDGGGGGAGVVSGRPIAIPLSDYMRQLLENDYHLVTHSNKLLKLPAKPNVLTILENYVIDFAMNIVSSNQEKSTRSSSHPPLTLDAIRRNINLCKEVADGLRIYFDFTLRDFLLYNLEREQCNQMFFNFKIEPNSETCSSPVKQEEVENGIFVNAGSGSPVYSCDKEASDGGGRRKSLRSHRFELTNGTTPKSAPLIKEEHVDSTQSLVANSAPPARQEPFITQIMEWKLIPPNVLNKLPLTPSQVYGATHLSRLFVKLPELMPSGMAEKKLDVCLRHFSSILKYLEAHPEWFDESHYQDNCASLADTSELMSN